MVWCTLGGEGEEGNATATPHLLDVAAMTMLDREDCRPASQANWLGCTPSAARLLQ